MLEVPFQFYVKHGIDVTENGVFAAVKRFDAAANEQVGPIGTIEHGNRAISSAARSGLPIWIAVSAALYPPPTVLSQDDDTGPMFSIPDLCDASAASCKSRQLPASLLFAVSTGIKWY